MAITVTTQQMFESYIDCVRDILWNNPDDPEGNVIARVAKALSEGNSVLIRDFLMDGSATLFLAKHLKGIEDSRDEQLEIRIVHNHKLLTIVLSPHELNY